MNNGQLLRKAAEAASHFLTEGRMLKCENYGNGHINDTFLLEYELPNGQKDKYILQRINTSVFTNPYELMENISNVTGYLKRQIEMEGGDPKRETINVIKTVDYANYYCSESGDCFRMYNFVERAVCYEMVNGTKDFYESAVTVGHFQSLLSDFPPETLYETIQGFHDTEARFSRFCEAVKADIMGRAEKVQPEIEFVMARRELAEKLGKMKRAGELPLRVTHNDTKLNNIMLDEITGKGVCVIDLDTVMPGLVVNDFGDSIRFGASTAAEDEQDLSTVFCSMELYEAYVRGFIEGCRGQLTEREMLALPLGAKTMTFECGMRFLTDYLEGDTYFRIHREGHNLDRCRTQFKLVLDMEKKEEEMTWIIRKYM